MVSDKSGQEVVVDEKWKQYDWKRRLLIKSLGEERARSLARPVNLAEAALKTRLTGFGRSNRRRVKNFANIHTGQRCVIIGNGPSLKQTNLELLRSEYTFGLNRIYLNFEEMGFATTYHLVTNRFVVEQCVDDFRALNSPLFTTVNNRDLLGDENSIGYLNRVAGPWFSRDASLGVCEGYTVTYVAMQLAYYMGFSEVILVGVDHKFAVQGKPNQLVESTGEDASHFDPRYFAKGFKWQLPDLENSEISYRLARKSFERDGRRIVDATVGGALDIFPKDHLERLLAR